MQGLSAVRLPQEVLDTVLENLQPGEDVQSLRQCALAARCLRPIAQRILFSAIFLSGRGRASDNTDQDKFLKLLRQSPHLAGYIVKITLFLQPSQWDEDLAQRPLPHIIPQLHALKRLVLYSNFDFGETDIPITSHQLYTLLGGGGIPRIRSMELVILHMAGIDDIVRVCEWLAEGGLQELQFEGLSISDTTSPASFLDTPRPEPATFIKLKNLTVTHQSQVLDLFLSWAVSPKSCLRFDELRELSVGNLTERSSKDLLRVLDIAKGSIRHIDFGGDVPSLSSIPFNSFRALRTIACSLDIHEPSPLGEWCTALTQNKELQLDSFIVYVTTFRRSTDEPWKGFVDHPWKDLEDVIINGTWCKQLKLSVSMSRARLNVDTLRECFPLSHTPGHVAGSKLVVQQSVVAGKNLQDWEYKPIYGEWKKIDR
ncbi:hypothetical protein VNI00_004255 [Paramarasmius palmivorus]|uniref:F-box domain-containing protein n=1 Tax=Paramarasmius palmivorus TaxID=297713 RepID=A0AAW0DMC8_9AGAR